MLLYKLKALECLLKEKDLETPTLKTVVKLEELLLQIDYRAEVLPEFNFERLLPVLEELQGGKLTEEEASLLREIIREIGT